MLAQAMGSTKDSMAFITAILAIGATLAPILFGFIVWKMSGFFVTKENFHLSQQLAESYRQKADEERKEMKERLARIEEHTNSIANSLARWEGHGK